MKNGYKLKPLISITLILSLFFGCVHTTKQIPKKSLPVISQDNWVQQDTILSFNRPEDTLHTFQVEQYRQFLQMQIDSLKSVLAQYPFLSLKDNVILQSNYLKPVFNRFKQLKLENNQLIEIIHIGDSHIQSRWITQVIQDGLQKAYGNAGPGYFFGLSVEKIKRKKSRLKPNKTLPQFQARAPLTKHLEIVGPPYGLSGFTAIPKHSFFDLEIPESIQSLPPETNIRLALYCDNNRFAYLSMNDQENPLEEQFLLPIESSGLSYKEVIYTVRKQLGTKIRMIRKEMSEPKPRWFGWSFQTNDVGVLYHTIGMNGASYYTYNNNPLFFEQINVFSPQLYIISLGTNDGYVNNLQLEKWMEEVDTFVKALQNLHPQAQILITTPPDASKGRKKKKTTLSHYSTMSDELKRYCAENHLACWDFYQVMGGTGSIQLWHQRNLAKSDYVHFTSQGYWLQANAFLLAFFQSMMDNLE